jgi:ATP synthase protein I
MTETDEDPMLKAARLRATRRSAWLSDTDKSPLRRLGQIGVLGWIVVTPMLMGIFAGRWLDLHFHSGLFWTAPLLMLGAALGCWSAWKWMGSA